MTAVNHYMSDTLITHLLEREENIQKFLDDLRVNHYTQAIVGTPDMDNKDPNTVEWKTKARSMMNLSVLPLYDRNCSEVIHVPLSIFNQITQSIHWIDSIFYHNNVPNRITSIEWNRVILPMLGDKEIVMFRTSIRDHSRLVDSVEELRDCLTKNYDVDWGTIYEWMSVDRNNVVSGFPKVALEGYDKEFRIDEKWDFQRLIREWVVLVDQALRASERINDEQTIEFNFSPTDTSHHIFPE